MGLRLIGREKLWIFACQLVFLDIVLSLTISRGYLLTAIGDITQCMLLMIVLLATVANFKSSEPRSKLFWTLITLGVVLWFAAQALWTYFEVFLRREVPNPFVGDVILFLHLVPMMGAIAVRPDYDRGNQVKRLGAIDFVLLLMWWLYLYLYVVIPWQYVSPDAGQYGRSFDALYMGEHFVFLVCAAGAWVRSHGTWKTVYGHLFGASALYALGSISASVAIDLGRYYTGSVFDAPLIVAMVWFASVGLVARKLTLRSEPAPARWEKQGIWFSSLAMLAILSLPVMAAGSAYFGDAPARVRSFRMLLTLGTMLAMGTLVWIKQFQLDRELQRVSQDLREDSLTDSLTGARNRRFLTTTIDGDVRQVIRAYSGAVSGTRQHNRDLAFYLIDADSFKAVNDRYGHAMGDVMLMELARRISSAIRHSDVLIRWGGDEFMVASRYTDRNEAQILAERVLKSVGRAPFTLSAEIQVSCTCSIGWAVFPWYTDAPEAVSYEEVVQLADNALYEAKKQGRNRAVGMRPTREEPATAADASKNRTLRLEQRLGAQMTVSIGPESEDSATGPAMAKAAFLGS